METFRNSGETCFPIPGEVIEQAIKELSANMPDSLYDEGYLIELEDPCLTRIIDAVSREERERIEPHSYWLDGALFMRGLLRRAAKQKGLKLPTLNREDGELFFKDKIKEVRKDESVRDFYLRRGQEMLQAEPELERVFVLVTLLMPGRAFFYGGASDIYFFTKKLLQKRGWGKRLDC